MIESDVISYLKSDEILKGYLSADADDCKIYPLQAPQLISCPYITYNISHEGTVEENLREIVMNFVCTSDSFIETKLLRDRLIFLLDRQDKIRDLITSADYIYYWCKKSGGLVYMEAEQEYFYNVSIYNFKYAEFYRKNIDVINKVLIFKVTGTLIDEETVINKFHFNGDITINKLELHCRTAPIGANITVDLLKNNVEQSVIANLTAGQKDETTVITPINFSSIEDLGIIVKSVGTIFEGEDLTVVIHYQ
jgi:hypothetical protein